MKSSSSIYVGVLLGSLIAFGVFTGYKLDLFDRSPVAATVLDVPQILADFSLVDHTGNVFDRERLKNQWSLVFFGFTSCGDVCPVTLAKLNQVAMRVRPQPAIIFVSVDPGRDSPAVLAKYVQTFGDNITGVTGDPAEIDKLTKSFFASYSVSGDRDSYTVDHSSAVFLVNPDGNFAALFSAPIHSKILVEDIHKII
jgi:protein SCO1/2